ncbi:MAG: glycosyltransferase [Bacteroidetes bacterium]|nr:glycosyltransferase [Bacteroidota bacterium]
MKVLVVIGCLARGGSERQLVNIVKHSRSNIDFQVVNWDGDENDPYVPVLQELGVNIYHSDQGASLIRKVKFIRRLISLQSFNAVFSFSYYLNFPCYLATRGLSAKLIGSLRCSFNDILKSENHFKLWLNFYPVKTIVVNSLVSQQEVEQKANWFGSHRFKYLPNRINVPADIENSIKARLKSFENKTISSLSIGRCDDNKRIDYIIIAIKNLADKGYTIKHTHLGKGDNLQSLIDLTIKLGIDKCFIFKGEVNDITPYLHNANVFVHAALNEGSPNVVKEAQAYGLPTVSSNCGDASFIINEGATGFIINQEHFGSEMLAIKLEKILTLSKDCYENMMR